MAIVECFIFISKIYIDENNLDMHSMVSGCRLHRCVRFLYSTVTAIYSMH
jgi:hypothetical protein